MTLARLRRAPSVAGSLARALRRLSRQADPLPLEQMPGIASVGRMSYASAPPTVPYFEGDVATVAIGSFVSIASEVVLIPGGNHRVEWATTSPLRTLLDLPRLAEDVRPASKGDITIGNDVWIGYGATILSGVTIGHGAVIGARAVVARDVRPYAIVVGNPAAEIKRRFDDSVIDQLLALRWWDWTLDDIARRIDLLNGPDVDRLLQELRPSAEGLRC
jgi:acetyltransferase-like isoleucine patch superfamily enzyme